MRPNSRHRKRPARLQHAVRLGERPVHPGDVADAEGDGRRVEAVVGEGQRFGVAASPVEAGEEAAVDGAVAADLEHRRIGVAHRDPPRGQVRPRRPRPAPLERAERDIAGAARDVEQILSGAQGQPLDQPRFPEPVNAPRHEVVHQVVALRNAIEDVAHEVVLALERDVAKAEVSRILCFLFKHLREHSAAPAFTLP